MLKIGHVIFCLFEPDLQQHYGKEKGTLPFPFLFFNVSNSTNSRRFEAYAADGRVKAAVERKFVTIGEALMRLRREAPDMLEHISGHYRIIGFRNVLVDGYDVIDDATVWSAVTDGDESNQGRGLAVSPDLFCVLRNLKILQFLNSSFVRF